MEIDGQQKTFAAGLIVSLVILGVVWFYYANALGDIANKNTQLAIKAQSLEQQLNSSKNIEALCSTNLKTCQKTAEDRLTNIDTPAADFRIALNNLATQQVDFTVMASRRVIDGMIDQTASERALENNSVALAVLLEPVYGPFGAQKIAQAWGLQNALFIQYARALKSNDAESIASTDGELQSSIENTTDVLTGGIGLNIDTVRQSVSERVAFEKSAISSYAAGQWGDSYVHQTQALGSAGRLADAMAIAIVKEHPELFR
jgi:hypothetical protein